MIQITYIEAILFCIGIASAVGAIEIYRHTDKVSGIFDERNEVDFIGEDYLKD